MRVFKIFLSNRHLECGSITFSYIFFSEARIDI